MEQLLGQLKIFIGSYFAINLVNCLALKLIQHGIAIGAIKNLHTGSYFAINLVNCLALFLFYTLLATSFRRTVQVQMNEKNRFVANMRGLYEIKDAFSSRCCFWRESLHFLFVFFCKWGFVTTAECWSQAVHGSSTLCFLGDFSYL